MYNFDLAHALQGAAVVVANAKYTTAAAITAAAVRIDTSLYAKERALLVIINEDTTAATALTIKEADTVAGALSAVAAGTLTDPYGGAAATLDDLTTSQYQTIAVDLNKVARYLTVDAATDPTTANGAAVAVLFLGRLVENATAASS